MHGGERPHSCQHCGRGFVRPDQTKKHEIGCKFNPDRETSMAENRREFPCHLCPHISTQKCNLLRHVQVVHEGTKNIQCDKCDKKFATKGDMTRHQLRHHDNVNVTHKCPKCNKVFRYVGNYQVHVKQNICETQKSRKSLVRRQRSSAGRPKECSECGESFPSKKSLKKHVEEVHIIGNHSEDSGTSAQDDEDDGESSRIEEEANIPYLLEEVVT